MHVRFNLLCDYLFLGIGGLSVVWALLNFLILFTVFLFASLIIYKLSTRKTICWLNVFLHLYVTCKLNYVQ